MMNPPSHYLPPARFTRAGVLSYFNRMQYEDYRALLESALREDLLDLGDVTSGAIFDTQQSRLKLVSKDTGVLAGVEVFSSVFREVDGGTMVELHRTDGDLLSPGERVATISGRTASLLSAERTAINFLGFLSGIATETRRYVNATGGKAKILDTRKTLPGFRVLSKYAVVVGGAVNHRRGLYDMVLIKDNHIDEAGSISRAVDRVRRKWGTRFRVEVECRSEEEVREALGCAVDVIMLDNMSNDLMRRCVALRTGNVEFEASGNMTLERIPGVSKTGVDAISIGALTHSVRTFDFSLTSEKPDE